MQQIRYSTLYLAALSVTFLVLIFAGTITFLSSDSQDWWVEAFLLGIGIIGLPPIARYLFAGGLILEYDQEFVTYHGVFASKTLHWVQVERIEIKDQGDFPRNRFLHLRGPFTFYGYAPITERLLDKRHRPLEKLQDELLEPFEADHTENPERFDALFPPAPVEVQGGAMPDTRSRGVIGEMPEAKPFGRKRS